MVFENWRLNVINGLPKVLTDVANDILISRVYSILRQKFFKSKAKSKDGSCLTKSADLFIKSWVLLYLKMKYAVFSRKKSKYKRSMKLGNMEAFIFLNHETFQICPIF